jgi:hypothetical protein
MINNDPRSEESIRDFPGILVFLSDPGDQIGIL